MYLGEAIAFSELYTHHYFTIGVEIINKFILVILGERETELVTG
jgi:hypothetical protein